MKAEPSPGTFDYDVAVLLATASQILVSSDPMGKADELWELAEQVIDRHGAYPVAEALTMMIVAEVTAIRVCSPGLEAAVVVKPALDLADMSAQGDSPARWWVLSVLANPGCPYPDAPSDESEAFALVIGLVGVLLVTHTQRKAEQAKGTARRPAPRSTRKKRRKKRGPR